MKYLNISSEQGRKLDQIVKVNIQKVGLIFTTTKTYHEYTKYKNTKREPCGYVGSTRRWFW